ncbi:hypothetical protein DXG01_013520 [Tephrocybe rancida]|nr:hypothetical protein DXG01_013520 [Tephrocybe rancida]
MSAAVLGLIQAFRLLRGRLVAGGPLSVLSVLSIPFLPAARQLTPSPMSAVLGRPKSILVIAILVIGFFTLFPWSYLSGLSSAETFDTWTNKRPNGVILILLSPKRIQQATLALRNVEDRFNRRLKYPYRLVMVEGEYEEVTEVQKERIAHITEGRAKFTEIPKSQWDAPASLNQSLMDASIEKIGLVTHYEEHRVRRGIARLVDVSIPADVQISQRLDTDVEFHCDVAYDPIQRVIDNNALYGFVQIIPDGEWVQPTLASNVSAFMATEKDNFPLDANHRFVWRGDENVAKALRGEAGNPEWTGLCMYNNFEISHRSIWENPIYTRFFEFLDRAGGFFYERWGDAPVHSFGIAMTLRKDQVVQFTDMGSVTIFQCTGITIDDQRSSYQHQGWGFICPVESSSCTCVQEEKFKSFKDGAEGWFDA